MSGQTIQESQEPQPIYDPEQFLRESGIIRQMQQAILENNVRRVSNEQGFEVVGLKFINPSVVRLTTYVGNEDEQRTNLRCRSMIHGLLRSAGVSVPRIKLFARYRRSVIRSVFVPDWD